MSIITRPRWSLGRGKTAVPSRWQATALLGSEATMGNGRAGRVHSVDESQGWLARRIQRQALLAPQSCQCRRRSVRTASGTCSPRASMDHSGLLDTEASAQAAA